MAVNVVRSINPLLALPAGSAVRVGRIVDVRDGRPLVDFSGAGPDPGVLARVVLAAPSGSGAAMRPGDSVLLVFEDDDARRPIIVGLVSDTLPSVHPVTAPTGEDGLEINGKRLSFDGHEEIVLRCGLASITLRADGQVVVKGTRLMSRASETNKVRGATVLIN